MSVGEPSRSIYPVRFEIAYPERLSRWKAFLRWLLVVPAAAIYYLVVYASGYVAFAALLAILFRKRYPRWWFDFLVKVVQYASRVCAYATLLRDEYPGLETEQEVYLEVDYPADLNRWLPLVKWLLVLPHVVVLFFLILAAAVVTIVAWFAILLTARYPRGLFDFNVGVMRWSLRVTAYALCLFTDRYPPFSLR